MQSLARRAAALAALVLFAVAPGARAAQATDALPARLPGIVTPIHYDILLEPDATALRFKGRETIDIVVNGATRAITLNALDLDLTEVLLDGSARAEVTLDPDAQTATLTFADPVPAGPHRLAIAFTGTIGTSAAGLFALDYATDAGPRRMLSMQLEPMDGRRVAPMWDEPATKATFALEVTIPREQRAFSNMPEASNDGRGRAATRAIPADAEDVVVPAAPVGGRPRASLAHDRRRGRRHRDATRRGPPGGVRARRGGGDPALVQRVLRHAIPVAEARHDRGAWLEQLLRRHGELGRDLLFRAAAAGRPGALEPVRPPGRVRGDRARGRAPVVRQPGHDALVGRPLAERRLRLVDGEQDHRCAAPRVEAVAADGRKCP